MALRYVPLVLVGLLIAGCGSSPPRTEAGPRLYLAGDGEMWIVNADAERVRHVSRSQLKAGDAPRRIVARGRRLVVGAAFGDSAFFLPSAHPDRVWVVDLDPQASVRSVREVTVEGVTTVHATRVPGGRYPLGAVNEGLLLPGGNGVDVWDPVAQRVLRRLRPVESIIGAASGDLVTACSDFWCGGLRVTDVRTGADRVIRAPSGLQFEPWEAAFSPRGDLLAVPVREPGQAGTEPRRLALVDVAARRLAVVAGSRVPAGYTLVAWSADGRYVFITGGDRFAHRVIAGYRLGTRAAHILDVDVGDFYDMAAI